MTTDRQGYAALGAIYDAATDQSRWVEAMDAVTAATGAVGAALLVAGREETPYSILALGGCYRPLVLRGDVDHYARHLAPLEAAEWEALARQRARRLLLDSEVADPRILDRRADYRFLREKGGIGRRVGVRCRRTRPGSTR